MSLYYLFNVTLLFIIGILFLQIQKREHVIDNLKTSSNCNPEHKKPSLILLHALFFLFLFIKIFLINYQGMYLFKTFIFSVMMMLMFALMEWGIALAFREKRPVQLPCKFTDRNCPVPLIDFLMPRANVISELDMKKSFFFFHYQKQKISNS